MLREAENGVNNWPLSEEIIAGQFAGYSYRMELYTEYYMRGGEEIKGRQTRCRQEETIIASFDTLSRGSTACSLLRASMRTYRRSGSTEGLF